MVIYLDQNKWIELAQIYNKKKTDSTSKNILKEFEALLSNDSIVLPLSAMHYIETERISNSDRRYRLGSVMWKFSKGNTLASFVKILEHEIETSISSLIKKIQVNEFSLIGYGVENAFDFESSGYLPDEVEKEIEESFITGKSVAGVKFEKYDYMQSRVDFKEHLETLRKKIIDLPKNKWDDCLKFISYKDIIEPLSNIMKKNGLNLGVMAEMNVINTFIESLPSRAVDIHLHKQVLKNPEYRPKITDLEDWAGLGVASQYCDLVICEKHMADMLKRDGFKTKARIETKLKNAFKSIKI